MITGPSFPQFFERESSSLFWSHVFTGKTTGCPIKDFGHDKIENLHLWTNANQIHRFNEKWEFDINKKNLKGGYYENF